MVSQAHADRSQEINITEMEISQLHQIIDSSAEI